MAKPMRNVLNLLLGLLLTTPVVVGGELIWIEDDGSTVEPASLLKAAVSESHLGFPDDDNGPGTLLSWRYGEGNTGGPDLDAPLVTDRPDFTEASSTVGRGVLQIEFGYTLIIDDEPGLKQRTQSAGEPLLRWGIGADWLELRLALLPVHQRTDDGTGWRSIGGTEDLYLGTKIALTSQECHWPETALIVQSTVPTGSNQLTNNDVLPGVNLLYSWELNESVALGGSTQANRAVDGGSGEAYSEIAQSATVVLGLSDEIGMFTEWFAMFPNGADTAQVEHYLDGGFTFLLSNDVQFDVRAGYGMNRAANDFFAGAGLSIRFK